MSKITVLGLGAMGRRLAVNYAAAGHEVTVWNRGRAVADELAARHSLAVAATPSDGSAHADVVVSMVADDDAARRVWLDPGDGALAAMRSDSIAIESSTLTPGIVRELGDAAARLGVSFVEAPVVGSRPQAEAGALVYLLGGDARVIEACGAVIDVNAGAVRHVGEVGSAAVMKLAINGLFAAQVAAYAEILGFVERSGLDGDSAIDTLTTLPITSPGLQRILGLVKEQAYEPNFPVRLVAKDLSYLASSAADAGAAVPIIEAASSVFRDGAAGAERDLDIAGIAARYVG